MGALASAVYCQTEALLSQRIVGGCGSQQEMITEDLCALTTLKISRPVTWEYTRQEQIHRRHHAHPMITRVKVGAKKDVAYAENGSARASRRKRSRC